MKATKGKTDVQSASVAADTVPRLVRFPAEDDRWLEEKASQKARERGRATVQDCVRELVRRAREAEAQPA